MMMSLLERLNHAFSGGIMFVQPTAVTCQAFPTCLVLLISIKD